MTEDRKSEDIKYWQAWGGAWHEMGSDIRECGSTWKEAMCALGSVLTDTLLLILRLPLITVLYPAFYLLAKYLLLPKCRIKEQEAREEAMNNRFGRCQKGVKETENED